MKPRRKPGRPTKSKTGKQDTYIKVPCLSEFKEATEKVARIYGQGIAEYIRNVVNAQNEWAVEHEGFIKHSGVGPKYRKQSIPEGFFDSQTSR